MLNVTFKEKPRGLLNNSVFYRAREVFRMADAQGASIAHSPLPNMVLLYFRILTKYYTRQRKADNRNSARTTIRLLESLIRLAQAHARLLCRDQVTVQDAVLAITLMECSLHNAAIISSPNILHTRFPEDCEAEYQHQVEVVLNELDLAEFLEKERT